MIQLNLKQGSQEWLSHRSTHRNASDTPAVMGSSTYKTRSEFLVERATGIYPDVDVATQKRFDDGHRFEAMARPLMEAIAGEDLYPVVGVDGVWSASFDGLDMLQEINGEHKTLNDAIRSCQCATELPAMYREQMEHQMMVSGAKRSLFMATKWRKAPGDVTEEGKTYAWAIDDDGVLVRYSLEDEKHFWYEPDMELRSKIIAAWDQFDTDVAAYQPEVIEAKPILTAKPIEKLPTLFIEVTGRVTQSNLVEFKAAATAVISSIKTELVTDQDFVDAIQTVKDLKDIEDNAKRAKQNALDQTTSIAELHRALDEVATMAANVRKSLDKKISEEKDQRKSEIVTKASQELVNHIMALNERLGVAYMPRIAAPFGEAIKGLKSLDSMKDKVSTALANAKIEANAVADLIDYNIKTLTAEGKDWKFLFPDLASVVTKAKDDFTALLMSRVAQHKAAEAKRLEAEREKIRAEEQAKAQREADARMAAEREEANRVAAEEIRKADAERKAEAMAQAEKLAEEAKPVAVADHTEPALAMVPGETFAVVNDCLPRITLGEISNRLGYTVSAAFLATLGFEAMTDKNAKLYNEASFPGICRRISDHTLRVAMTKKSA